MFAKFFLDRPIFTAVIAIFITMAGLFSLIQLPIEQYPNMTPPLVLVSASYPGASAETITTTVTAPLEQQINGVENMIYMYSQNSMGNMALNVYFDIGTDPNLALTNTQNRVNLAMAKLPEEVQRQGITVKKQSPTILLAVAIFSEDQRYDEIYVNNFATIYVVDELKRLKGVSDAKVFNVRDYAIRIWLHPDRMAQLKLSTSEVMNAIRGQNAARAIGELGQAPTPHPVVLTIPVDTQGLLNDPREYGEIILRAQEDGSMVKLSDVATVDLGAQSYNVIGSLNGKRAALIGIYQEYGANALEVADKVKSTIKQLSKTFPKGIDYSVAYDTTPFIRFSIRDVGITLLEASLLVAFVILVFLQSLRSTLIPVIAMIVSIIGTLAGMQLLGFSLNTLTLFGMVLAVGIVVDDAIVVVESIEHNMRTHAMSSKEAALKTMGEVSAPVIAIVFVLSAVFLPVAFMGGIAGQLYKQFAITIALSVAISGFIALSLSPVLATLMLKDRTKPTSLAVGFNKAFTKLTDIYERGARWILARSLIALMVITLLLIFIGALWWIVPKGFVPNEDQGYLYASSYLPDGASVERVNEVALELETIAKQNPAVVDFVSVSGFSLLEMLPRNPIGTYFISLKNWEKRKTKELQAPAVLASLNREFSQVSSGINVAFNPPAIQGIGIVGGLEFWILNRGGESMQELQNAVHRFLKIAKEHKELGHLTASINVDAMQLYVTLDTAKTQAYQVKINDVFETLQVLLGSFYVNNFTKYGRVFQVISQADPRYRTSIDAVGEVYVKSATDQMIPLKSLLSFEFSKAPTLISRFNGFNAVKITATAAPHVSSDRAMQLLEEIAYATLDPGMTFAWSGEAYQQKSASNASLPALIGALVMVYLVLAALYERWRLPFAILLAIPFGIFGALVAVWISGMQNDIYFQIGLITLMALSAKNAILIVEFAHAKRREGLSIDEAALFAARLRFRAILMTSLTFILGVLPLVLSTGAGAASRHSVGTGVIGGMMAATFFAIFFVPLFFKIIERKRE